MSYVDVLMNDVLCSAWVVLGKPKADSSKAYQEVGFQGHLTKVQIWGRALDVTNEIQKQVRKLFFYT